MLICIFPGRIPPETVASIILISGDDWSRPVQIIKPEKYTVTDKCVYRDNWQMVVCEDNYGKVMLVYCNRSSFLPIREILYLSM